jgi:hypothetical protein
METFVVLLWRGNLYSLSRTLGSEPARTHAYGRATDEVLVGDWDGDGVDTLAMRRGNRYYLKNDFLGGSAVVSYGRQWEPACSGRGPVGEDCQEPSRDSCQAFVKRATERGRPAQVDLDDLSDPARLTTIVAAGVPLLQRDNC